MQSLAPEGVQALAPEAAEPAALKRKGKDDDHQPRAFISKGEKATNFGTYAGVDWLLNAAAGVSFAYWGDRTAMGQRLWSKPLTEFFKKHLGKVIKDTVALEKSAGYGNMFMSIIAGGMATLPPLLLLENNKVKKSIVQSVDHMIYGKDAVDNDPKFQQAYKEIEDAPKKNFWTGMGTRFLALSPLLAIVLIPETKVLADKYYFKPLANGTKWLSKKVGLQPAKLMEKTAGHPESAWDYIHAALAMDFGLGPWYAILHSYTYNFFAGKPQGEKKPEELAATTVAIPATEPAAKLEERPVKQALPEPAKPTAIIQQPEHHATLAGELAHAL